MVLTLTCPRCAAGSNLVVVDTTTLSISCCLPRDLAQPEGFFETTEDDAADDDVSLDAEWCVVDAHDFDSLPPEASLGDMFVVQNSETGSLCESSPGAVFASCIVTVSESEVCCPPPPRTQAYRV